MNQWKKSAHLQFLPALLRKIYDLKAELLRKRVKKICLPLKAMPKTKLIMLCKSMPKPKLRTYGTDYWSKMSVL